MFKASRLEVRRWFIHALQLWPAFYTGYFNVLYIVFEDTRKKFM